MVRIQNILWQMLGQQSAGVTSTAALSSLQNTQTSTGTATTDNFATVLAKLNSNIDNAYLDDAMTNLPISSFYGSTQTKTSNPTSSIVSLIAEKIKNNQSGDVDIEGMVRSYLSDNYDSSADVISSLSGVDTLPTQVTQMQDQIYEQIISKLAGQVREKVYSESKTDSLYYGDDDTSDSETTTSSIDL